MKISSCLKIRTFHIGIILALSLTGVAKCEDRFLYFVPEGVSPNGKFVFSAFRTETELEGKDIGYFFCKIDTQGKVKIASSMAFNQGKAALPRDLAGPRKFWWSAAQAAEGGTVQNHYVCISYLNQTEGRSEIAFLRLVDGEYELQYQHQDFKDQLQDRIRDDAIKIDPDANEHWVETNVPDKITLARKDAGVFKPLVPGQPLDLRSGVYVLLDITWLCKTDSHKFEISAHGEIKIGSDRSGDITSELEKLTSTSTGYLPDGISEATKSEEGLPGAEPGELLPTPASYEDIMGPQPSPAPLPKHRSDSRRTAPERKPSPPSSEKVPSKQPMPWVPEK